MVKLIGDDPWQQLVDAVDRMLGNASDHVAQVGLGLKAIQFGCRNDARWCARNGLSEAEFRKPAFTEALAGPDRPIHRLLLRSVWP